MSMSYRFGLWSKLASVSVLVALFFCWPSAAQEKQVKQAKGAAADGQEAREKKEDADTARKRIEWFYNQRAYPLGRIPANARGDALRELDQMLEREGKLVRQADGSLTLAPAVASVTTNIWTPIGPQPTVGTFFGNTSGRVNALAVDPTNPNNVFLGGAQGGIWRSTDGGINWTPLTDSQASLAVGSIAIDPTNPNIVYVGTGEENFAADSYYGAGILKTTNALDPIPANVTWTQLGQSVFLGTGSGPISSVSGGARIGSLAINPTNGQILLAGVQTISSSSTSGIYCSDNGGTTWTQVISGAPGTDVVFDPGGKIAYAAIGRVMGNAANGVYKTLKADQTCSVQAQAGNWTLQNGTGANVLPSDLKAGRISLALAPSSPTTIYASIQDPAPPPAALAGFFVTTDGGTNWTKLTNTPDFCNPQCWYDMVVRVKPDDPMTVFAGGSATGNGTVTLIRSKDGGANWENVSSGVGGVRLHVDHHALAFSKPGTGTLKLYVGNDGGAWSTTNILAMPGSITWVNLNDTLNITQFYPAHSIHPSDQQIGFGGTQDNGSQNYTGTLGWVDNNTCGDGGWTAIDPAVPSNVYVTCQNVDIEKSTQNGDVNTFRFAAVGINPNDNNAFIPPFVIDPSTPQRLYFGTVRLWQTTDGAGTWSSISGDLTGGGVGESLSAIAVAPSDSKTVYVGSSSGHVQVSTNVAAGSATFADVSTGLPGRAVTQIVVDPVVPTTAYVTFSGFNFAADMLGHVFKTTNGGTAWLPISGNLPNTPVNDLVIDPDDASRMTLYAATDIGVFQTVNSGATWSAMNPATQGASGLPRVAVLSLRLHEPSRTLRAATHGRGVWDLTLPNLAGTPTFSLSSIRPSSKPAPSASFQLTVNGNGFTANSVVRWNGSTTGVSALTFVSANQLTAMIAASLLATPVTAKVTVTDPGQANPTNSLVFVVTAGVATISSVMPSTVPLGSGTTTVTVNGSGFSTSAQVNFNGSATGVTTNPGGTSTQLTAVLSSTLLGGAFGSGNDITVVNPPPGGGASLPALFTVAAPPPTNDNFAFATVVSSGSFTNTVDSSGATTEATDPTPTPNCAQFSASPPIKTVWYKFTPGGSGSVTADTVGSSYDTILTVFTGAPGSFTQVACNDDITLGIILQSRVTFNVNSGTAYFLMVSAFGPADPNSLGQGGKTVFNLTTSVPVGSDFSVTSPTPPQTVNAGQPATYTITVGAVNGAFNNAVSLSCTGLPLQSSCSFIPPSVTPGGTSANSTLTISTTARSAVPPAAFRMPRARPFLLPWPMLVLLALAAAALALRARQRRWAAAVPLVILFVLLAIQVVGCGGNPSGGPPPVNGTPAGTYPVTVTGTSSTPPHSITVTLNVN
jgi:hypothetical protein